MRGQGGSVSREGGGVRWTGTSWRRGQKLQGEHESALEQGDKGA